MSPRQRIILMRITIGVLLSIVLGFFVEIGNIGGVGMGYIAGLIGCTITLTIEILFELREVVEKNEQKEIEIITVTRRDYGREFLLLKRRANRTIRIMGVRLRHALQAFVDEPVLIHKVFSGTDIRLMFLNPNSPYAEQRAREDGVSHEDVQSQLIKSVSISKQIFEILTEQHHKAIKQGKLNPKELGRFEIRLFESCPYCTIFHVDNDLLWGLYFANSPGLESPMYKIAKSDGKISNQFISHFDKIWDSSWDRVLVKYDWNTREPYINSKLVELLAITSVQG